MSLCLQLTKISSNCWFDAHQEASFTLHSRVARFKWQCEAGVGYKSSDCILQPVHAVCQYFCKKSISHPFAGLRRRKVVGRSLPVIRFVFGSILVRRISAQATIASVGRRLYIFGQQSQRTASVFGNASSPIYGRIGIDVGAFGKNFKILIIFYFPIA